MNLPDSDRCVLEELGFIPVRQARPRIHCAKCQRARRMGEHWTVVCTNCHDHRTADSPPPADTIGERRMR